MTNTIKQYKELYKIVVPTSPIYKGCFKDKIDKLPDLFYKKNLFDEETKARYCAYSLEYIKGFFEVNKNQIKEPNIEFINIIPKLLLKK